MSSILSPQEYYYKVDSMLLCSVHHLRELFQARWKAETGKPWENTEVQGKEFIEGLGEVIFKKAGNIQKRLIEKGCLDKWDLSTLSVVLQNFGKLEKYQTENEAVKSLTQIRNELAHHATKQLSRKEYNEKVKTFKSILQALHINDEAIEKLVEKAGILSSAAALKATKNLYETAEKHLETGELDKAINCFDEATTMGSLPTLDKGVAYEKRAECYLMLANIKDQDERDKCIEQALIDANAALELNNSSWKAHYLIGQCHQWKNCLSKAINHYERALAISPSQTQIKRNLDCCKYLDGTRYRQEHLSSHLEPKTLQEWLDSYEMEKEEKMTKEQLFFKKMVVDESLIKGQAYVFLGHNFRYGWDVAKNDEEATRYYQKAADVGNAEGIYNLGMRYHHGLGVSQDLPKAFELYFKAAQMSPDSPGLITKVQKNMGVAYSQFTVGLMYSEGIVVEQDLSEAAMWYKRAAKNGAANAAHNLGLFYRDGEGVQRDIKMAEMFWNQAVILGDSNAASTLMQYYLLFLEPERARAVFLAGKSLGNVRLVEIGDEGFDQMIQPVLLQRKEVEADVLQFEELNGLSIKGLNFWERLFRMNFPACSGFKRWFENWTTILKSKKYLQNPVREGIIQVHRQNIKRYVDRLQYHWYEIIPGSSKPSKLQQQTPKNIRNLMPITLAEMNPTLDHIYEDRVLDLVIIEDPSLGFPSIHLVAEDENGDVTRLYVYNVEKSMENLDKLGFGCRIAILNPYMRIGVQDRSNGIRNDEPSCVIYLGRGENMCRFCGEENAPHTCSRCKRAKYCSRECQKYDWYTMKHKLICWKQGSVDRKPKKQGSVDRKAKKQHCICGLLIFLVFLLFINILINII